MPVDRAKASPGKLSRNLTNEENVIDNRHEGKAVRLLHMAIFK